MDQKEILDAVKDVLGSLRTISTGNLSTRLTLSLGDMQSSIRSLETAGVLRISRGKSCGTACSSCTACPAHR